MKIKLPNELLIIGILAILLIVVIILLPSNILRAILGVPFVIFIPGYTLLAALLPGKSSLESPERIGLSFALSVSVIAIIGTIIDYTPQGFRLYPVLVSLLAFIFITSLVAWYRRRRLTEAEQSTYSLNLRLPRLAGQSLSYKILSITLVVVIIGALGVIGYAIATPKTQESFTEFYLKGTGERAEDYPRELRIGEEGRVILSIINHEHRTVSYWIETRINGVSQSKTEPILLNNDETGEKMVSFAPNNAGDNQKVEFLLYKNQEIQPYLSLHLWLNAGE